MYCGKNEHWNEDVLNANLVEPCLNKARKCTKPDNSKNLTIGCFVLKMASVKDKEFSLRVYSDYEDISKIVNVWKIANMIFLVEETCTKFAFLTLGWGHFVSP